MMSEKLVIISSTHFPRCPVLSWRLSSSGCLCLHLQVGQVHGSCWKLKLHCMAFAEAEISRSVGDVTPRFLLALFYSSAAASWQRGVGVLGRRHGHLRSFSPPQCSSSFLQQSSPNGRSPTPCPAVRWAFPAPGPLAEGLHRTWRTGAAFCKPSSGSGWQSLPEILSSLLWWAQSARVTEEKPLLLS